MKKLFLIMLACLIWQSATWSQDIKPEEVKNIMIKVANWQIEHYRDTYSDRKKTHHPLNWTNAALYIGMEKLANLDDNEKYYNWLKEIGNKNEWMLHERIYHADDHAVGQMYVELYRKYKDESMIKPLKERLDFIYYHPSKSALNWKTPYHLDRWNWCDALFMSPPLWAKLYKLTDEKKYLDFMMEEYKATTDFLFDKKEHLFYRDERFKTQSDHGTKVFWSRGNGWVFAGLANIMSELESDSKEYKYFLNLYQKMAKKLLELQTSQGHWSMSLLGAEFYPTPETSGSSFFLYGLAWGVNQGILDKKIYENAIIKGWKAMVDHVSDEGMLGYVQPIGAAPGEAWPEKTEVYGTGAFLCAGSEIYKML